jgi:disulfide bond formation protein DsbB
MRALLFASWLLSLVSTLGSLFFSEIMKLPPCVLCWYQRIAMYPLVLVLGVAWFAEDLAAIRRYGLPLALAGLATAAYHNLLYYGVIPESLSPCVQGISCTSRQLEWLGFVTIPLLALVAFASLVASLLILVLRHRKELS